MGLFTDLIDAEVSDNLELEGTTVVIKNKYYKWKTADCGKHLKATRGLNPHCGWCTQSDHLSFLKDKGCTVLDRLNHNTYLATLPCNHDKAVHPDVNYSEYCQICRDSKALQNYPCGTEILGYHNRGQRVTVKFPCGHVSKRHTYTSDTASCMECKSITKQKVLEEVFAVENSDGTYTLGCGHVTGCMSWNKLPEYRCRSCENEKLYTKAKHYGLVATGNYDTAKHTHEFTLQCGHTKYLRTTQIKNGTVCPTCAEDHLNKPCDMYFLHGFTDDFTFLKIGIANDTERRIKNFNCPKVNAWFLRSSIGFKTKREALKVEQAFHKKFAHRKLDKEMMKQYMRCGFTECYPTSLHEEISDYIAEMQKLHSYSVHYRKVNTNDH